MEERPLHIGIIGTGFGAKVHLPGFQLVSGARVFGIAAKHPDHAAKAVKDFPDVKVFDTWEELVVSPDIDAVSITSPQSTHRDIVLAALNAGKHVLCEKPLGLSLSESSELVAAAEKSPCITMMNFEYPDIPAWEYFEKRIKAGDTGDIVMVNARWISGGWADPTRPWSWRHSHEERGGVLTALGVHAMHYLERFFGKILRLTATTGISISERKDSKGKIKKVTAEDHALVLMEGKNGFPMVFTVTNVAERGLGHIIEVVGSKKTLVLRSDFVQDYGKGFKAFEGDHTSDELCECKVPGGKDLPGDTPGLVLPFSRLATRFVHAISVGDCIVQPSFRDAHRANQLLSAIETASKEQRWMDTPEGGSL